MLATSRCHDRNVGGGWGTDFGCGGSGSRPHQHAGRPPTTRRNPNPAVGGLVHHCARAVVTGPVYLLSARARLSLRRRNASAPECGLQRAQATIAATPSDASPLGVVDDRFGRGGPGFGRTGRCRVALPLAAARHCSPRRTGVFDSFLGEMVLPPPS